MALIDTVRTKVRIKSVPVGNALSPCILLFHVTDDGLSTIIYMDVLDADKLLPAIAQPSKNLNLRRIRSEQTIAAIVETSIN